MRPGLVLTSIFLFLSGMCGLIYQVVWFQELRLVFGTSTAACSAVVAIFMAGLGLGSLFLGRLGERSPSPLRLYGNLELGIAASAMLSPFLLEGVRAVYLWLGGTATLGSAGGAAVRGLLSALVLGVPTFLMGGTLPAALKAGQSSKDSGRTGSAVIYGSNTLGAVLGASLTTFWLLETFGLRRSLFLAAGFNLFVGLCARAAGGTGVETPVSPSQAAEASGLPSGKPDQGASQKEETSIWSAVFAAFVTGFAFFLMETVWYRMLAPLLGGSVFAFGMVLASALLGIGLGGFAYSFRSEERIPTWRGFSLTCALEAAALAFPFWLGDGVAILLGLLEPLDGLGFFGKILGWNAVISIVILPAAFVSGIQFPLLLGIVGRGKEGIAQQVGIVYAANTLGAVAGSLAGGFGLIALASATGCWKLAVLGLAGLSLFTAISESPGRRTVRGLSGTIAVLALVGIFLAAEGPTVVWRHSQIGTGREKLAGKTVSQIRNWVNFRKRSVIWEADGKESCVGLTCANGLAFVINGKIDGNALGDAGTQIMLGIVGAILHPDPRRAFVIGLGTGSTGGWLGAVPGMEKVDIVELEERTVEVASRCSQINCEVLRNPKVNLVFGDAREVLLTTPGKYDLIVSEPSNPFRAGVSTLFTREFYQAVIGRLRPGGVFSQWVQAYEVDSETIGIIFATVSSVFPHVEVWQTSACDLLLTCSIDPIRHSLIKVGERLELPLFKEAMWKAWHARGPEGLYGNYLANSSFLRTMGEPARMIETLNTDDHMILEYGFARTLGNPDSVGIQTIGNTARQLGMSKPPLVDGILDPDETGLQPFIQLFCGMDPEQLPDSQDPALTPHIQALKAVLGGDLQGVRRFLPEDGASSTHPVEIALLAQAFADLGDDRARPFLDDIENQLPLEKRLLEARLAFRRGNPDLAAGLLAEAFRTARAPNFTVEPILVQSFNLAVEMGGSSSKSANILLEALGKPLFLFQCEELRKLATLDLAGKVGPVMLARTIEEFGPNLLWNKGFLTQRFLVFQNLSHPMKDQAAKDLQDFLLEGSNNFTDRFFSQISDLGSGNRQGLSTPTAWINERGD